MTLTRFIPMPYARMLAEKNKMIRHIEGQNDAFFVAQSLNGFDAILDADGAGVAAPRCLVYVNEVSSRLAEGKSDNFLDQDFHTLVVCVRASSELGDGDRETALATAQTISNQLIGRLRYDRMREYNRSATAYLGAYFILPESITRRSLGMIGKGWMALAIMFTTQQPTTSTYHEADWDA
jgi:hypothetical protein